MISSRPANLRETQPMPDPASDFICGQVVFIDVGYGAV
jgi:hypothetical protein